MMSAQSALNMVGSGLGWLLNLFYPPQCAGCETFCGQIWCERCAQHVQLYPPALREWEIITEAQRTLRVISCAPYGESLRKAITSFKYEGNPRLAVPLAEMMRQAAQSELTALGKEAVLVPVPLHSSRMRERGYNQSALLAKQLGALCNLHVLKRIRKTHQQAKLDREQRKQNLLGAFWADAAQAHRRRFLLVDDVLTTGATLAECADALLTAGAQEVRALTLARADS